MDRDKEAEYGVLLAQVPGKVRFDSLGRSSITIIPSIFRDLFRGPVSEKRCYFAAHVLATRCVPDEGGLKLEQPS